MKFFMASVKIPAPAGVMESLLPVALIRGGRRFYDLPDIGRTRNILSNEPEGCPEQDDDTSAFAAPHRSKDP
jgi:hypothetical protein